jgi:hypothetical protein
VTLDDRRLQTLLTQPRSERWAGLAGTDNDGFVVFSHCLHPTLRERHMPSLDKDNSGQRTLALNLDSELPARRDRINRKTCFLTSRP